MEGDAPETLCKQEISFSETAVSSSAGETGHGCQGCVTGEDALPSLEESCGEQTVLEQRVQMWGMYQTAGHQQFCTLSELCRQLQQQQLDAGAVQTPGRARLTVRLASCHQLYQTGHQQSAALAEEVRHQAEVMTSQLERYRSTCAAVAALVESESAAREPTRLVAAVRGRLLGLTEKLRGLETDLAEVRARHHRALQRLDAPPEPHPAQIRLDALTADYDRRIEQLQTRSDNVRAQTEDLQTQLREQREAATAAQQASCRQLQQLQSELQKAHHMHRDSQRELYKTRHRLTRECGELGDERDSLTSQLSRYRRLEQLRCDHGTMERDAALSHPSNTTQPWWQTQLEELLDEDVWLSLSLDLMYMLCSMVHPVDECVRYATQQRHRSEDSASDMTAWVNLSEGTSV